MTNYNPDEIDNGKQITQKGKDRPELRQRHKYTKDKKFFDKIMLVCIKQPLSNN